MIGAISTALTGLFAASKRAEASASNIANMSTAGSVDGTGAYLPYQAQTTVQTASPGGGVTAMNIPKKPGVVNAFAPDSPFANSDGLVAVPNVDLAEEAVNLKLAELSYKANVSVIKTAEEMSEELLKTVDKTA
jgi:flagellar basal-body rod protein FlgC